MPFVSNLDTPLLQLSAHDNFTLRDACAGVHVFGGIGSGKASGSGKMLAGGCLRAGLGGLVTAVKPDEVQRWQRHAREHGREPSLILFDENEGFNFLGYEMARRGRHWHCGGMPDAYPGSGEESQPPRQASAGEKPSGKMLRGKCCAMRYRRSLPVTVVDRAARHPKVPLPRQALAEAINFWAESCVAIPEKTRGNIVISVTTVLDRFKHGRLNRIFCGSTTIVPELTFHGAVIVLAMPTLTWNEDGIVAQQIFKYMW